MAERAHVDVSARARAFIALTPADGFADDARPGAGLVQSLAILRRDAVTHTSRRVSLPRALPPARRFRPSRVFYAAESARILSRQLSPALRPRPSPRRPSDRFPLKPVRRVHEPAHAANLRRVRALVPRVYSQRLIVRRLLAVRYLSSSRSSDVRPPTVEKNSVSHMPESARRPDAIVSGDIDPPNVSSACASFANTPSSRASDMTLSSSNLEVRANTDSHQRTDQSPHPRPEVVRVVRVVRVRAPSDDEDDEDGAARERLRSPPRWRAPTSRR